MGTRAFSALLGLLIAALAGCGDDSDGPQCTGEQGSLGCACLPGEEGADPSCLEPLDCLSDLCVGGDRDRDRDGIPDAPGDGDGDGDTGSGDGDTATGDGDGDTGSGSGDGDTATGDGDGDTGCTPGVFDETSFDEACFQ